MYNHKGNKRAGSLDTKRVASVLPCSHVLKTVSCVSFLRNGLGPVKEGEAQYAVVHCTGYIKAWPPAGEQNS